MTERLRRHNSNHSGYTGKIGDWEIMYTEEYEYKQDALKREKEIKGWKSRSKIIKLISPGK
jgi:putative endonuclease